MTRDAATKLTRELLNSNNLLEWRIRLANDLKHGWLGKCVYSEKAIYLNIHHVDTHPDIEVDNTIRHEIAHALTPGHQHDNIWQDKAKELGCTNTQPCANYGLSEAAIDAVRSGQVLEVTFEEQVIRTPKYKVTRLQDKCPECGKVAKEKWSKIVNTKKIILLECGHVVTRVVEASSPFETIVFDGDSNCKHDWNKTVCVTCNAKRLFPFQIEGAQFLEKANGRAAIFDEMGLGKTVQSLAWIKFHPEALPVLYIVKSGIKWQWAKEIVRILGMKYAPQVIQTSNDFLIPGFSGYVVSYDMLVPKVRQRGNKTITSGFDITKFKTVGIKTVITDECQQIKNPDSTRTQMVRQVVRDAQHFIPLSGTPWKNRGSEFFPVLNMLDPQRFYSYQSFLNRWVEYYWDGDKQKMGGIANPKKFKEFVQDIVIRRERTEVMPELPLIQRNALYAEMDETASKAYSNEVNDFVKFWNTAVIGGEEDDFATSQNILARLTRMRHITGLAKIPNTVEYAKEFLEDTDRKLVIFVHHKDVGQIVYDQIADYCSKEHLPQPLKLTADLTSEARYQVQQDFNSPNYRILIASTLASGEGLNLQTCCDCIMHERQWNPANEEQAEGRFIRIGQQSDSVNATYMLAQGSIDDLFHGIVERKRRSFHAAMNKGEQVKWNETSMIKELAQAIVDSQKGR